MITEGIIFDKDGTLLDFDAFWVKVSVVAIKEFLSEIGAEFVDASEILTAFGIHDGKTETNGILYRNRKMFSNEPYTSSLIELSVDKFSIDTAMSRNVLNNKAEILLQKGSAFINL